MSNTVSASLLNHFQTAQSHCKKKWNQAATDLCPCGEKQTMSHIVDSCPLSKLNDSLSQLHSADDEAVAWLISYGFDAHARRSGSCNGSEEHHSDHHLT